VPTTRLHVERAGRGPALLLLHGIGSNSRSFRHQLGGLSDTFSVLAWDAPGYGQSDDPPAPFTLEDLADEAARVLDEHGVERAHVLGVSLGGVVAQLVYHRHARRVQSLVLVDTTAGGGALPEPERSERVRRRLDAIDRLSPRELARQRAPQLVRADAPAALVQELEDIMAEVRPAGYRNAALALGATDVTSLLGSIRAPTLVVHGADDAVVPLGTGRALAAAIPGAELVVVERAGHVSNQEQPETFNAVVRQFLMRHC
jgi:pimeloyl-ACP methyl ester carboxylesterase